MSSRTKSTPTTPANAVSIPSKGIVAVMPRTMGSFLRLEFAMEGHRWYDLVRWGIAEETLNAYLAEEKTKRDFLANANFTAGRDEYYPIPQREIDFTGGLYVQNPGY